MGDKLASFLRVLGSGLSPQAFDANVRLFEQEKAQEFRVGEEKRADDRNIKNIGITQTFASLGVLAEASRLAKDDPKAQQEIGTKARQTIENIGDPRLQAIAKDAFMAQTLQRDKQKGSAFAAIDKVTKKEFMAVENEQGQIVDPVTREFLPNAVKAPSKSQVATTDLTKAQTGKLKLAGIEGEQGVQNNVREIGKLIETISSPDFLGGNTGALVQSLNSAKAQVTQLFGGEDFLDAEGKINPEAFKANSRFRKMAIQGDLANSQTFELAFIMAKSLNNDGKISDADVEAAREILGGSADPKVRAALLRDVQRRTVDRFNSDQQVIARRLKQPFTPLKLENLLGGIPSKGKNAINTPIPLPPNAGVSQASWEELTPVEQREFVDLLEKRR